jgi:hypothetical protein
LHYVAISPRHLEACATRTCQVLVEGEYNGVLIAGRHYLELKRDFRNLEELLGTIKEDRLREQIVANAYRDVVESGKYTYRAYVDLILREALPQVEKASVGAERTFLTWLIHEWMRASDYLGWIQVALSLHAFRAQARNKLRRLMVALLSEEKVLSLLKRRGQSGSK